MTRVQLELNLQIAKLQLKVQPSTPPEIREQHTSAIAAGMEDIGGAVHECMNMLEQALEVLMTLQEDPNIQWLEIEACKLQQQYDNIRGTTQIVVLTQQLTRMHQAKELKAQVDATRHKEAVLKARIQRWIDEAFTIMPDIEEKFVQIQGMRAQMQGSTLEIEVSEERMQQVQQAAAQCVADIKTVRDQLEGLCTKIVVLTE